MMKPLTLKLGQDLVALYGWHNGTRDTEAGVPELFPGGIFMSLQRSLADYQGRVETARRVASPDDAVELFDPTWFPIFVDAGGNPHVSVTQPRAVAGSVWFVPLEEPESRYTVAGSLAEFVLLIIDLYQRGAYFVAKDGDLGIDIKTTAAVTREHLRWKPNVPALVASVASDDPSEVARAFDAIRRLLFPEAADPLIQLMQADNPAVRRRAALLLGMLADRSASAALENALEDADASVRAAASSALSQMPK
jgi:cell wall assembly regulator SMI1